MPKTLDATSPATQQIFSKLTGIGKKKYTVTSGQEMLDNASSFNLLLFGEYGSGKTFTVIGLLLLGMKVLVLNTDFGKNGINTVKSYFKDHPEHAHLLKNLRIVDLDLQGFMGFCRTPDTIVEDVYTWDPDVLFWDGATAFQQADLEAEICGNDFLRESSDWADWRKTRNGTIFPLMKLMEQHNLTTGKRWSKVVTTLEKESMDKRRSASPDEKRKGLDLIPGSEKRGPMLHTEARDIAGAGFDIIFQSLKQTIGDKEKFLFQSRGKELMVRDRGFNFPARMDADFAAIFRQYIAPKTGWVESKGVEETRA